MSQLGLSLGEGSGAPMPPYQRGSETSKEAARQIAEHAGRLQRKYLKSLYEAGERGLIDHEAKAGLKCSITSVQPRRKELNEEYPGPDLVVDSGDRRPSPMDRPCTVWTLSERGRDVVEHMRSRR